MRRKTHSDDSELATLEVDLSGAPGRMQRNATATLRDGARLINRAMIRDAKGHTGTYFGRSRYKLKYLPRLVSHEMVDPLTAEIGIEARGQGLLANIIVKGSVNNAPVYDYMAGPRKQLPAIEKLFADAAEKSVLGDD